MYILKYSVVELCYGLYCVLYTSIHILYNSNSDQGYVQLVLNFSFSLIRICGVCGKYVKGFRFIDGRGAVCIAAKWAGLLVNRRLI